VTTEICGLPSRRFLPMPCKVLDSLTAGQVEGIYALHGWGVLMGILAERRALRERGTWRSRRSSRVRRVKKERSTEVPIDISNLGTTKALGQMIVSRIEAFLDSDRGQGMVGQVDLIVTSPPFPLVRKKAYGNATGQEYLSWLTDLAPRLAKLLKPTGSIILEIGNAWTKGSPVMSTLPLESLIAFKNAGNLNVCQQMICHNPARLPSPAEWVNVRRIRLKDSFTHVWWMAPDEFPKADNSKVLLPYGLSMKKLLERGSYNSGRRPSGHVISEAGFLSDHGGAISPSVLDLDDENVPASLLRFSNTAYDQAYRTYCKQNELPAHPARMQAGLVAFFVEMLTDEADLVFDPFGGSNTTGAVAEQMNRKWVTIEADPDYVSGSRGRFDAFRGAEVENHNAE
jgi:DNA modification methylase